MILTTVQYNSNNGGSDDDDDNRGFSNNIQTHSNSQTKVILINL